jgi:hypothetical protein
MHGGPHNGGRAPAAAGGGWSRCSTPNAATPNWSWSGIPPKQIYGWRGARDVMTGFAGRQFTLSHSFRFGEQLAAEANRWLAIVNAPVRLVGSPAS